jgi:hypothetical protein
MRRPPYSFDNSRRASRTRASWIAPTSANFKSPASAASRPRFLRGSSFSSSAA